MAKHPIQHVEWRTRDRDRLKSFYGSVFDWSFKDEMGGSYTMVDFGAKDMAGGLFPIPPEQQMPTGICNYVTVEDLAPYEDKIRASGGNIMMSGQEVPGAGWFSLFSDPDGNFLGLWKSVPKPKAPPRKKRPARKPARRSRPARRRK